MDAIELLDQSPDDILPPFPLSSIEPFLNL